jgi:hypothetical protein
MDGGLSIVAIGIAWPFVLAVCIGIEERAVARLLDYGLRQHWRGAHTRENGHRAKKFTRRHCVSPMQVMGSRLQNNTRTDALFLMSLITEP